MRIFNSFIDISVEKTISDTNYSRQQSICACFKTRLGGILSRPEAKNGCILPLKLKLAFSQRQTSDQKATVCTGLLADLFTITARHCNFTC